MSLETYFGQQACNLSFDEIMKIWSGFQIFLDFRQQVECKIFSANITGASMNPARSLGPALTGTIFSVKANMWTLHYIYYAGPFIGAIIAAAFYRLQKLIRKLKVEINFI